MLILSSQFNDDWANNNKIKFPFWGFESTIAYTELTDNGFEDIFLRFNESNLM